MDQIREIFQSAVSNQYVLAASIVVVSLIATVVADFIASRVFRVLAKRSSTTIDDEFVDLSHRPVRTSVLLLGLWLASNQLELSPRLALIITATLKTVAVFVWLIFGIRFISLLLKYLSTVEKNITWIVREPRALPSGAVAFFEMLPIAFISG